MGGGPAPAAGLVAMAMVEVILPSQYKKRNIEETSKLIGGGVGGEVGHIGPLPGAGDMKKGFRRLMCPSSTIISASLSTNSSKHNNNNNNNSSSSSNVNSNNNYSNSNRAQGQSSDVHVMKEYIKVRTSPFHRLFIDVS